MKREEKRALARRLARRLGDIHSTLLQMGLTATGAPGQILIQEWETQEVLVVLDIPFESLSHSSQTIQKGQGDSV